MLVRNGCVGDWRLGDEDFMASFRLPTQAEKRETLMEQHPFPREKRIVFDEAPHTYTVDDTHVVPRSVTGVLHQFVNAFDADVALAEMRARNTWVWKQESYLTEQGEVMSDDQIKEKWAHNGLVQRSHGTLLHYHVEQFLNGASIEEPHSPEFQQFLYLHEDVIAPNFTVYRTEISLFHVGLQVAGQADCLCLDADGSIAIWDWKRSKEIRMDSLRQMRAPLVHLPDSNYFHYALQLNLYRYMLESEYDLRVSRMLLGVVHPLRSSPLCLEIPRMDREVGLIVVEHEGNPSPCPGPDAPFA